jgi:MFS family permease
MYTTVREQLPAAQAEAGGRRRRRVAQTVVLLGLTSMFTDVSSEMVSAVLPVYLTLMVGLTPLQFGVIDGLYQGVTALVRLGGGVVADRWRRYKEVATFGYALSAVCKLGLLAAGAAYGPIAAVVAADRTGKGVRTAPRDALISFASRGSDLGRAFGVHRAMDTAGALAGPLVAFGLLAAIPRGADLRGGFDVVFLTSFCVAVVGLAILVLFVRNPAAERAGERSDAVHGRPPDSPGTLEAPEAAGARPAAVPVRSALRALATGRVRPLVVAGVLLSLVTASDSFVYLALQRRVELDAGWFPLLFVGTALVYLALAVPLGHLADRIGRHRVFIGGHLLLVALYGVLMLPSPGLAGLLACLALLGAWYAATDGVLAALTSAVLPPELRTSGLAMVATAVAVGKLVASVVFGALWTMFGPGWAVAAFAAGLAACLPVAAVVLAWAERRATGSAGA